MKVLMKASFAGMITMPAGSIQDMDEQEAERMVRLGYAEYVEGENRAEKRATRTKKPKEQR